MSISTRNTFRPPSNYFRNHGNNPNVIVEELHNIDETQTDNNFYESVDQNLYEQTECFIEEPVESDEFFSKKPRKQQ